MQSLLCAVIKNGENKEWAQGGNLLPVTVGENIRAVVRESWKPVPAHAKPPLMAGFPLPSSPFNASFLSPDFIRISPKFTVKHFK